MKILFLITNNYPFGNGETFIENEINYLSSSFIKIYIISINFKSLTLRNVPDNCSVYRINLRSIKNIFKYIFKNQDFNYIKDFFKNFNIDVKFLKNMFLFQYIAKLIEIKTREIIEKEDLNKKEIIFYSYWFKEGAYAGINLKRKNIINKVISRAHGYDIFFERGYQPLKNEILKELDGLYPACEASEKYLKKYYNEFEKKIKYSHLGIINKNNFTLKKKNENINIVSCSNLIPLKRVNLIIEALARIEVKKLKIKWTHLGDGIEKIRLEELAKEKLKKVKYQFLGHMNNEKVLQYYLENNINLFIHMSSTEGGTPVSMMEVQSFGIPIIATNVGGIPEIVNEKTGILLSEDPEIEEIVAAIKKMINLSDEVYEEYQKNSYENWKNNFNAEKNYLDFIEDIKKI